MNNKALGTQFEKRVCKLFADNGYWVHFISPDNTGAQPFDIIAVKDGAVTVGDCKTSAYKVFPISRLEDNQIMAFEKWMANGNGTPYIIIQYRDEIYFVPYTTLKIKKKVNILEEGWHVL